MLLNKRKRRYVFGLVVNGFKVHSCWETIGLTVIKTIDEALEVAFTAVDKMGAMRDDNDSCHQVVAITSWQRSPWNLEVFQRLSIETDEVLLPILCHQQSQVGVVWLQLEVLTSGEKRGGDEEIVGELLDRWHGDGCWIMVRLISVQVGVHRLGELSNGQWLVRLEEVSLSGWQLFVHVHLAVCCGQSEGLLGLITEVLGVESDCGGLSLHCHDTEQVTDHTAGDRDETKLLTPSVYGHKLFYEMVTGQAFSSLDEGTDITGEDMDWLTRGDDRASQIEAAVPSLRFGLTWASSLNLEGFESIHCECLDSSYKKNC